MRQGIRKFIWFGIAKFRDHIVDNGEVGGWRITLHSIKVGLATRSVADIIFAGDEEECCVGNDHARGGADYLGRGLERWWSKSKKNWRRLNPRCRQGGRGIVIVYIAIEWSDRLGGGVAGAVNHYSWCCHFDNEDEGGFVKWLVCGMTHHRWTLQISKELCRCKESMNGMLRKGNDSQLPKLCPQRKPAKIYTEGQNWLSIYHAPIIPSRPLVVS